MTRPSEQDDFDGSGWRVEYRVRCLNNPNHLPTVLPRLSAAEDLVEVYTRGSRKCGPHVIEQRTVAVSHWEPMGDSAAYESPAPATAPEAPKSRSQHVHNPRGNDQ